MTNVEEEEESVVEERTKLERAVMTRLASPCLQQLEAALQENRSLLKPHTHTHTQAFDVFQKLLTLLVFMCTCINFCLCLCVYPSNGRFKREVWEDILVQLAQIALFRYSPNLPLYHTIKQTHGSFLSFHVPSELFSRVSLHPSATFPRSSCWTCSRGRYPS